MMVRDPHIAILAATYHSYQSEVWQIMALCGWVMANMGTPEKKLFHFYEKLKGEKFIFYLEINQPIFSRDLAASISRHVRRTVGWSVKFFEKIKLWVSSSFSEKV